MIRASVVWGGTDREGSRDLFGRYGYGLPSASISQGKRLTVYSAPTQAPSTAVDLDIDEIRSGKYIDQPAVSWCLGRPPRQLPPWVTQLREGELPRRDLLRSAPWCCGASWTG